MFKTSLRTGLAGLCFIAAANGASADPANDEKMKKLAANAGCFTCHALDHGTPAPGTDKPIGPPWQEVARQYRDKPGAADFLTRVVLEGSNPYSSHWRGKVSGIAMPPNAVAISEADTRQLVFWILSLR